jgi:drug/metabolite transporter (DMT)-like permease
MTIFICMLGLRMNRYKLKLFSAFGAIYILWGSTYLANKFALETVPPFIMAGLRFTIAGSLLMLYLKMRGEQIPKLREWKNALIIGGFMLFIGNGFIVIAQQKIPSGMTALIISISPLFMTICDWLFNKGNKPKLLEIFGIIVGFSGVGLLVYGTAGTKTGKIDLFSLFLILFSSLAWTVGALYSKKKHQDNASFMPIAQQMISGGILLLFFSFLGDEWASFNFTAISYKSILSILYLIIGGSLIGYSSYIWLLKKCKPTLVSTNTFVNPVIALILGTTLAGELITFKMILASMIIISSVIIITISHLKK